MKVSCFRMFSNTAKEKQIKLKLFKKTILLTKINTSIVTKNKEQCIWSNCDDITTLPNTFHTHVYSSTSLKKTK